MLLQDTTTHYYVLGLTEHATQDDIKKAFRRLARKCHPDVVGTSDSSLLKAAEERFKRINYAHDILSDPQSRREYDRTYSQHRFVAEPDPAQSYFTTETVPYTGPSSYAALPGFDQRRAQDAWDEFISKPFMWSEKSLRFYLKWEWTLNIVCIPFFYLFITGQITMLNIWEFLLTSKSSNGVENDFPVYGMIIGVFIAVAMTLVVTLWAMVMHRYSFLHSILFRQRLWVLCRHMYTSSVLAFGAVGLLAGHYLF